MDPITALSAVALGLNAAGAISSGNQAKAQADFQSELYARQADRERKVAALEEGEYRSRGSAMLASQRARLGAAGVDFTGTALDVSEDTAAEIELQALKIKSGGEARASGLDTQGALTRYGGRAARSRGYLSAIGGTIEGAGNILTSRRRSKILDSLGDFG